MTIARRDELDADLLISNTHHPTPSAHLVGVAAAISCVLIWGVTFVPSKVALGEMGPFTLAVLRFAVALAVLIPIALRSPVPVEVRSLPWRDLTVLGLTGVAFYFGFQNLGLARTTATEAGLISGSVPAVTAALSAVVLRERMGGLRLLGIGGSIAGVAVMVLAGSSLGGGSMEGNLLMLVCPVAWAVYTLLNKRIGGSLPEIVILVCTMAIGTLFLLPGAVVELAVSGFGPVSAGGWLSVVFLGLGGSAAAFFCWNAALRRLDASEAATYINLTPLVSVVAAGLFLGEHLAPPQILGGAMVILGVYLAGR